MIEKCPIHEIQHLIQEYIHTLSSPFDSFLETHILASTFYVIRNESRDIGYYAIHNDQLLTQFYITPSAQKHSQELFSQVLGNHCLKSIFAPTCDELLLSLVLDKDCKIVKQAYFFQDSLVNMVENDLLKDDRFRPAQIDDLASIQQVCGDFLDHYERRLADGELFVYYREATLLGIGVLERSKLLDGFASIGMYTNEAYRKQGIGRNIILKLKKWCYDHELTPICGCWYYNELSKRALESAGMVTKTRLLNIEVNQV